jgi:chromosome segregation ATPase
MFKKGVANMDTHMAAPYCERLLADLFQCRKRMVDAMKRAKLALDKVSVFQSEYDAIERETRGLRRTQRLATTNSTFQAIKPTKRELAELKKKLDEKQNELSEIRSLLSGRKELLDISNRSVQGLKVVLAQKEDETRDMVKTLKIREDKMKSNLAVFRVTKDNYANERDEIEKILQQSQQRLKVVTIELKKVRRHKGKFVDTDVWQKGVMQRMLAVDIREHLEREQSTLNRVLHEFKNTLTDVKGGIYKCDKDIKTVMEEIEEVRMDDEKRRNIILYNTISFYTTRRP